MRGGPESERLSGLARRYVARIMTETTPTLEMRGCRKRYGGVQALAGADFKIYLGEMHALVGDNAAGKSTLIKILSGAVTRG